MNMKSTQSNSNAVSPAFLQNRVNTYYERYTNCWGGEHILGGKLPDEKSIILVSNDYLALNNHPKVTDSQIKSIQQQGNGLMISGVFVREQDPQRKFEKEMAQFMGAEDGILCHSGFSANVGLLQSIADINTPVYLDQLAHMSLWEGARAANAPIHPFRHNRVEHLEKQIKSHGSGIIVVDSIYSTTGSVSPLTAIAALAVKYDCVFIVDESHSLGTHGELGKGLVVSERLENKVHFRTASLAKAFCGRGGIIIGTAKDIEFVRYEALSLIFSTAVLPHDIAAFSAMLQLIKESEGRREKLRESAQYLREQLIQLGYNLNQSNSQIISLESGNELNTIVLKKALEKNGIFGSVFCPPTTTRNRSMIRFSLNAALSWRQIEQIAEVCAEIRKEVRFDFWPSTLRLKRRKSAGTFE